VNQTHCHNGHAFDERNTYRRGGHRACRRCNADASRRYKARRKAL
jgi:methylphosphotriester-DNA--protein-cysteine methyltransferase